MNYIRLNESIRIFFLLLLMGCGSELPTDSDFSYSGDAPPSLNSLGRLAVLATGGEGYAMAILDLDQKRQVGTFVFNEPVYRCAIRHTDNSIWFSLASGKGIFRIDPNTSKVQRQALPANGGDLAFSPNGETLYIGRSSLYIVDVKQPQQYQKVQTTSDGIRLTIGNIEVSRSGQVASFGSVVTITETPQGNHNFSNLYESRFFVLNKETLSYELLGDRVGWPLFDLNFSRDESLLLALNLAENYIAIHDFSANQTEHITFPDQTPGQEITPGGFDMENDLYYVLVQDKHDSGYYSDSTRVAVLNIYSKKFIRIHTLPGTYLSGVFDSQTSLLYLTGPHNSVTRDENNQAVPIQHISIYNPHTNQILHTIPIDSRIKVGAKIFM